MAKAEGFPYEVSCDECGAGAGRFCRRPSGHSGPMVAPHAVRVKWAEQLAPAEPAPEAEAERFTVKAADLFGNVIDTYATEGELNGWKPKQGLLL